MKNSFTQNVILNFVITVVTGVLSFLINRYFAIYLGGKVLGLMNLFVQLLFYINLADMGLATASTYALYKPFATKDYKKISIILNTMSVLYKKIAFFIFITGLIFNFFIPFIIKENDFGYYIYIGLYMF